MIYFFGHTLFISFKYQSQYQVNHKQAHRDKENYNTHFVQYYIPVCPYDKGVVQDDGIEKASLCAVFLCLILI